MKTSIQADLHLHSNHSDGNWSPSDLVAHAKKLGLTTIALTDHDTVSGIDEAIEAAYGSELEIIPAVEINTIWIDDNGLSHDIHMLGYFIDKANDDLHALFKRQKQARVTQVEEMIVRIRDDGIDISIDMVKSFAGDSPIGKLHVTQALAAVGAAEDVSSAYEKFYNRQSKYFVERKSATPHEALETVRAAGGIASIAHPGKALTVIELIEDLARNGLAGIEAFHRIHDEKLRETYIAMASRLNLIVTGGSDDHGPFGDHESLMGTMPLPPDTVTNLKQRARDLKRS